MVLSSLFPAADFQLQFTRFVASAYKSLQTSDRVLAQSVRQIAQLMPQIAVLSATIAARRI